MKVDPSARKPLWSAAFAALTALVLAATSAAGSRASDRTTDAEAAAAGPLPGSIPATGSAPNPRYVPPSRSSPLAFPVTSCSLNQPGPGMHCSIYESLADGTHSEISAIAELPIGVTAGYIVMLRSPGGSEDNQLDWGDVVKFIDPGNGVATTLQMLSNGCGDVFNPVGCFPSYATVIGAPHVFIVETQEGTGDDFTDRTVFTSTPNIFTIYSDAGPFEENLSTPTPTNPPPTSIELAAFTAEPLSAAKCGNATGAECVAMRWQTTSERAVVRFGLLRGASGRKSAYPVTTQPIAAQGASGGEYTFVDAATFAGTTYSYWLVAYDADGRPREYGPISVAVGSSVVPAGTPELIIATPEP